MWGKIRGKKLSVALADVVAFSSNHPEKRPELRNHILTTLSAPLTLTYLDLRQYSMEKGVPVPKITIAFAMRLMTPGKARLVCEEMQKEHESAAFSAEELGNSALKYSHVFMESLYRSLKQLPPRKPKGLKLKLHKAEYENYNRHVRFLEKLFHGREKAFTEMFTGKIKLEKVSNHAH